jgi:hypothetical protein
MDELIKIITQKTGIVEDKARTAAQSVLEFLKSRLPAPIANQLDNVVGGMGQSATGSDQDTTGIAAGLRNLVGGPKT